MGGNFREDLYYRLNVIQIRMPPLRERKEDIPLLVQYFLDKYSKLFKKDVQGISNFALNALMEYPFPGNVRELENIIERSVALSTSSLILPESLYIAKEKHKDEFTSDPKDTENKLSFPETVELPPEGMDLDGFLEKIEKFHFSLIFSLFFLLLLFLILILCFQGHLACCNRDYLVNFF